MMFTLISFLRKTDQTGMEWHHIHENSTGGAHSVENLTLATRKANSDFNVWFARPQVLEDSNGNVIETTQLPSGVNLTVRNYLKAKSDSQAHKKWGLYCIDFHGFKIETISTARGKYQKLVQK
jgi:hypothetical protein